MVRPYSDNRQYQITNIQAKKTTPAEGTSVAVTVREVGSATELLRGRGYNLLFLFGFVFPPLLALDGGFVRGITCFAFDGRRLFSSCGPGVCLTLRGGFHLGGPFLPHHRTLDEPDGFTSTSVPPQVQIRSSTKGQHGNPDEYQLFSLLRIHDENLPRILPGLRKAQVTFAKVSPMSVP